MSISIIEKKIFFRTIAELLQEDSIDNRRKIKQILSNFQIFPKTSLPFSQEENKLIKKIQAFLDTSDIKDSDTLQRSINVILENI